MILDLVRSNTVLPCLFMIGLMIADGLLIRTAYAFEQAARVREAPQTTPALKH